MSKISVGSSNLWKWLVLALIAGFSFYVCTPLSSKIRLGLDLAGGTEFILGPDTDRMAETIVAVDPALTNGLDAAEKKLCELAPVKEKIDEQLGESEVDDTIVTVIRRRVDAMGTNEPTIQGMNDHRLLVQLPGADDATSSAAYERLQKVAYLEFALLPRNNDELVRKLLASDKAPEGYVKSGSGYKRIDDPSNPHNYAVVSQKDGYAARLARFGNPGRNVRFMLERGEQLEKAKNGKPAVYLYKPNFVQINTNSKTTVTGSDLKSARVTTDSMNGKIEIAFKLSDKGEDRFARLTRQNVGRQLAIVLDDELVSAPTIQSEIRGEGRITGSFTTAEAQSLASDLNAGAMPVPMKIIGVSKVDPTVGVEAIAAAKWSASIGFVLVAIFMFIYYWRSGLVADIALFLDVTLLPTALVICANILGVFANDPSMGGGALQLPVLTMPGIAGLVLSLGMAVDANVLIFERIREEFQAKKAAGEAITNGYARAFTAILDSNLTTIITGIILFVVGTGPVRGFAIMLTSGVVLSMFTAIVVTRLVFDHCVDPNRVKPFKMMQVFKNPNFDFMKVTKYTVGGSFAFIAVALVIFGIRLAHNRADVLAVDLTGGTAIVYNYDQSLSEKDRPSVADIRDAIKDFDNGAVIQYQSSASAGTTLLVKTGETSETVKGAALNKNGESVQSHITGILAGKFENAKFHVKNETLIGSSVGNDLRESGTKAVLFSLIAILAYVGFRFRFGFGLGALAALAHDALISLAIFSLCGRQVSLIVITALLTIIGYSVNDTVVVFDRIREMLRRDKKLSFYELCNAAVNSCLSRTVITSVTTLFAVLALFTFSDGSIFDFALIMLIGIIAGTFSSVFIATPIMYWWYKGKRPAFESETTEG